MKCSFCSREIKQGKGRMYVLRTGKVSYFCSSKCRINALELKRKPQKLKWVKQ